RLHRLCHLGYFNSSNKLAGSTSYWCLLRSASVSCHGQRFIRQSQSSRSTFYPHVHHGYCSCFGSYHRRSAKLATYILVFGKYWIHYANFPFLASGISSAKETKPDLNRSSIFQISHLDCSSGIHE